MSDEYVNSGFQGSLVDNCATHSPFVVHDGFPTRNLLVSAQDINDLPREARDAATGNYPADGDSTSSGGYGSTTDTFSGARSSGLGKSLPFMPEAGLMGSSVNGNQTQARDAAQGVDSDTRRDVAGQ
ncbi:hypothetical protein HWV62_5632 [Athelia sp. TMB]|nr:hypothetical protein HWV62_5632 [Athelia sp. TMB]